jgi:RES domain-containing protein
MSIASGDDFPDPSSGARAPARVVNEENVSLLRSPAFALPQTRAPGDFGDFLEQMFATYHDRLAGLVGALREQVSQRERKIQTLSSAIAGAWRLANSGDLAAAATQFGEGLDAVGSELRAMSRRHARVLPSQSWYRLAARAGVTSRAHMFHAPFELAQAGYRFSTVGSPTLYLANSVYLCWLECGRPKLERCFVSRFEVDVEGFHLFDIPSNSLAYVEPLDIPDVPGLDLDPRRVTNSPYAEDVTLELAEYLTLWPLLAAATVRRVEPSPKHPPEYLVPQLLMLWVRRSEDFLGVRYFTSRDDPAPWNTNDHPINLALPARTAKQAGYCDFLRARARCTEPQPLAPMAAMDARELVTPASADWREERSGRYMVELEGVGLTHYFETPFGKMEYWLDRPEFPVGPI